MSRWIGYFFFVLILGLMVQVPWQTYHQEKGGWDHHIYCKAVQAVEAGKDPYITANLGLELSFPYPAIFLKAYQPLCTDDPKVYIFAHFAVLLLAASVLIAVLKWDAMITLAWVFLGYNAANANYHTGNVGAFEALFFALFLVAFVKKQVAGTLWLVPASFLKLIPSVMILPALFTEWGSFRKKAQAALIFGFGLLGLILLNFIYSQDLFMSFWLQAMGKHPGQHSPIREIEANPSNPTVLIFFQNISEKLLGAQWWILFSVCLMGLAAFTYWIWKKALQPEQDRLKSLCWSYLILFLWIPRLKPYSLVILSMLMIPLLQVFGRRFAILLLLLTVFHRTLNGDKANAWWDFLANNTAIYTYFIVLVILVLKTVKTQNVVGRNE